ncbi:MAG: S8 family serine peptidase, partial [Bacteroidota bacterium]
ITPGNKQVSIAILDTGLDEQSFPEFFRLTNQASSSIVTHYAVEDDTYTVTNSVTQDENGHGTAVAALAANQFYKAERLDLLRLLNFPILDLAARGNVADLINALDVALAENVDVINLSLGFMPHQCDEYVAELLAPLFNRALDQSTMIFVAAGNDGADLFVDPRYPANNNQNSAYFYTVGASNCADEFTWDQSNRSQSIVDFTAPGDDVMVPYTGCGGFVQVGGTSFATPLSSSLAAVLLTNYPVWETACRLQSRVAMPPGEDTPGSADSRLGDLSYYGGPIMSENGGMCSSVRNRNFRRSEASNDSPYPNPVSSELNVPLPNLDAEIGATISVRDLSGRVILRQRTFSSQNTISLAGYPAGVYILAIDREQDTEVIKIIKQ